MADFTWNEMIELDVQIHGKHGSFCKAALGNPQVGDLVKVCDGNYIGKCSFSGENTADIDILHINGKMAKLLYYVEEDTGIRHQIGFVYDEDSYEVHVISEDGVFIKKYYNQNDELVDTRLLDFENEMTYGPSISIIEDDIDVNEGVNDDIPLQ